MVQGALLNTMCLVVALVPMSVFMQMRGLFDMLLMMQSTDVRPHMQPPEPSSSAADGR